MEGKIPLNRRAAAASNSGGDARSRVGCGCKGEALVSLSLVRPNPRPTAGVEPSEESGRGAAWIARLLGVQEVRSSNLLAPTHIS